MKKRLLTILLLCLGALVATAQTAYEAMEPEDRVQLLRTLFMTLERLS